METTPRASEKVRDWRQLALGVFLLLYLGAAIYATFRYDTATGLWVMLVGTGIEALWSIYILLTPRK